MKKIRVGIAGLGRLGRVHAENLAFRIPNAQLCAVCAQIEAALKAGLHVFFEKPLGTDPEECLAAQAVAEHHPELVCMPGFMRRYDKSYVYAKAQIDAGAIGKPYMMKCTGIDPESAIEGTIRIPAVSAVSFWIWAFTMWI